MGKFRIVVDWGTTNLRAFLVASTGQVVGGFSSQQGVKFLHGNFESILTQTCRDWLSNYDVEEIVLAGMIGSDLGWTSVPLVSCPARAGDLTAGKITLVREGLPKLQILPGVSSVSENRFPGMMRGEEVLVVGAGLLDSGKTMICLPGTHSKWVGVEDGAMVTIRTFMTGELFSVLSKHSVLKPSESAEDQSDMDAFREGVRTARDGAALAEAIFSVRARRVLGLVAEDYSMKAWLSGLLIGNELSEVLGRTDGDPPYSIHLIADAKLKPLYCEAAQQFRLQLTVHDAETCFVNGALRLVQN